MRLTEWAADDFATNGDAETSITLASALVRFARYQTVATPCEMAAPLVGDAEDLTARVHRLLEHKQPPMVRREAFAAAAAIVAAACLEIVAGSHFTSMQDVHRLVEFLLH